MTRTCETGCSSEARPVGLAVEDARCGAAHHDRLAGRPADHQIAGLARCAPRLGDMTRREWPQADAFRREGELAVARCALALSEGGSRKTPARYSATAIAGIEAVSDLLAAHFPQDGTQPDEDELPNRPHLL